MHFMTIIHGVVKLEFHYMTIIHGVVKLVLHFMTIIHEMHFSAVSSFLMTLKKHVYSVAYLGWPVNIAGTTCVFHDVQWKKSICDRQSFFDYLIYRYLLIQLRCQVHARSWTPLIKSTCTINELFAWLLTSVNKHITPHRITLNTDGQHATSLIPPVTWRPRVIWSRDLMTLFMLQPDYTE